MSAAKWKLSFIAALAVAAVPGIANAQGLRGSDSRDLLTPFGEYFLVGGGVTDFTDDDVGDRYDVGGTWDVRLGFGSRHYVGGEIAYVGSRRSGTGSVPDLTSNGAEGVLRLQYPYSTGNLRIAPFAFGGIGWSRVSLDEAPAGVKDDDDVGVVPFGAGLTLGYGRVLVDARFTYRTTFDEDLPVAASGRSTNLEQWAVGASVGYEF